MQIQVEERTQRRKALMDQDTEAVRLSFDPVLHGLLTCATANQLSDKIDILFQVIDVDESGSVSFEEMRTGFKKLNSSSSSSSRQRDNDLSLEEFESLCGHNAQHVTDGELTAVSFKAAMLEQLRLYGERKLSQHIIALAGDASQVHTHAHDMPH
jgi:Ca2+-binding EF-hand superfamily protein